MIDSHIHIDLFKAPLAIAERLHRDLKITVSVTMLPNHYQLACRHLRPYSNIYPAIGAHPLRAIEASREIQKSRELFRNAAFVGEIGLDNSREGKATFEIQKKNFDMVLSSISPRTFVTVHSRDAEAETLEALRRHSIGPVCFHYFTGGKEQAKRVIAEGHYLSFNHKMLRAQKHIDVLSVLPRDRLLFESDGPFLGTNPTNQLRLLTGEVAKVWGIDVETVNSQIEENFSACRSL